MKIDELEKEILKVIANRSIYSITEIKRGYEVAKSFDVLIEAINHAPEYNISLAMAIRTSPIQRRM